MIIAVYHTLPPVGRVVLVVLVIERRRDAAQASESGQSETPNHVRSDGSFPPKRSPGAGDGCTASRRQPGLLLVAELDRIADAGAGDPGICNRPQPEFR
jgi:hypothetical protein